MKLRLLVVIAIFQTCLFASTAPAQVSVHIDGARQPQLAAAGDRAYVAFVYEGEIRVGSFADTKLTDRSTTVAKPAKLVSGMRRGPRIAASGDNVVVTAIAGKPEQLMAWRSEDGGQTWAQVADSIAGEPGAVREGLHDMAAGPDGKMAVVWLDLRNVDQNGTEIWMAESDDAGKTWGEPRIVHKNPGGTVCECCYPNIAYDNAGEPVVMFRNALDGNRDMYLWRGGEANKLGKGTWQIEGCPMDGGDFAVYTNSTRDEEEITTAWRREGTIYTAGPVGEEIAIADGRDAVVAITNAGIPVVFYTNSDGLFASVTHEGTFNIDRNKVAYPAVVALGDSIVVAYESGDGVKLSQIPRFDRYEKIEAANDDE